MEKNLKRLGVFGIISLLSYTAMVVFSPLAYPGYDWMSMAVSDLCAEGAPSEELASQLNALFGPCALVSVMAVCVGITGCKVRSLKLGIYCFTAMEWVCNVGYEMFPWMSGAAATEPQNVMHFIVTILIVALSLAALILTESSKSPASIAQSNKQRVRTCLYQEWCKPLLISCEAAFGYEQVAKRIANIRLTYRRG